MFTEIVMIVGSWRRPVLPFKNERVNVFILPNVWTRQNLTSHAQVGGECIVAAFLTTKFIQKPQAVFRGVS